jgi:hypothetical protein
MTEIEFAGFTIRHAGPGPYVARSASDKRADWPFWMVVDAAGSNGLEIVGTTAKFLDPDGARLVARALNEARP